MSISFQKCTVRNLKELQHISKETFIDAFEKQNNPQDFWEYVNHAFSEETLSKQLLQKGTAFYFAYSNSSLVGYFKINAGNAQSDVKDPESLELERIYVLKAYQGKQFGAKMLEKAISIAKEMRLKYLWLGVWEHNTSAIRFYERFGFKKFGEHPYIIGNDVQTDWLMKLHI